MQDNEVKCRATGRLFYAPSMHGERVLVSTQDDDYAAILAQGIQDEEVLVTVRRIVYGSEYSHRVPEYESKAGLYTITMNGLTQKYQLDMDERDAEVLRSRGFSDGDEVEVLISKLPYRTERKANYDSLTFGLDI